MSAQEKRRAAALAKIEAARRALGARLTAAQSPLASLAAVLVGTVTR